MAALLDEDDQPFHLRKYNEYELQLRTQLADQIGNIARHLKRRNVLRDHEFENILTAEETKPEECVSKLIKVLKKYEGGHFENFMECLTDLGYVKLVKKIRGNEEMEEYEEIDPSYFMQCDVDSVTGCDIDFVRDKFGQGTKDVYPMRKEKRGICLIINNYFYPKTSNKYRAGTEKDVEALKALFEELEFVVQLKEELPAWKIIKMLESCRLEINSSDDTPDCFILFILTHGKEGCVQGTDGEFVDITKIRDCFDYNNCPKLQGKPKLFFIQACQGSFVSYRHPQHGSWFVQAIVATCKTYACRESFQKMMERIAQEMKDVGSNRNKYEMNPIKKNTKTGPKRKGKKNTENGPKRIVNIATPCFENELKKDLFFFPKSGTDLV